MDSILYDDDDEGNEFSENSDEMDYDYGQTYEQETISELYQYCIYPTINSTFWYLVPVIITSFICNISARISYIPHKLFHLIRASTGLFIIWHYAYEGLIFLILFVILFYFFMHLPKELRMGTRVFVPSLILILYCEFFMKPKEWHKIRGVIMIAVMKATSVAVDKNETESEIHIYEYMGYMLCGVTLLFGPWTSFENYRNLHKKTTWKYWWLLAAIGYMALATLCLCVSNCWTSWILSDSAGKWIVAFRDALSFRTSHYFVCLMGSSIILIGGYPLSQTLITKPLEIEVPRSLVQVVINWNIPMHTWLKTYVFRPGRKQLGRFGAIIMTYVASSLLHGLNFQLTAVLLSLGFYTYIEYQLRTLLANVFDACIAPKQCSSHKCEHSWTPGNSYWVCIVNGCFGALAMFHLAYLGLMFDTSDAQETGYSFSHTIEKWSQLKFASHWIALASYCAYYLIR